MAESVKSAPSRLRRVIGGVIFVGLAGSLLLMFHKPAPVAAPMNASAVVANADAFQQKLSSLATPAQPNNVETTSATEAPAEIHLTADEVQAALVQANSPSISAQQGSVSPAPSGADQLTLDSSAPVVTFENDEVKGQFQAELAGQKVIVTVAGHLGAKDGYATFEPTEFKIGGLAVPVSMVNDSLQKKMLEQRDRMKLPDFISDIGVQNSQLVIKRK